MEEDLMQYHVWLARTTLIWSDMLEWQEWKGAVKPSTMDLAQRKVTRVLLSDLGQDTWLADISEDLLEWLQQE